MQQLTTMKTIAKAYRNGDIPEDEMYEIKAKDIYLVWSSSQKNSDKVTSLEARIACLELEIRQLQSKLNSKVRIIYGG